MCKRPSSTEVMMYYVVCAGVAVIILLIYYLLKQLDRNKIIRDGMGGKMLRWYDVFGHLKDVLKGGKDDLSKNLTNVLEGHAALFPKDRIVPFYAFYTPFYLLIKAKGVEELLGSTTHLEKAFAYKFIHPWLGTGLLTSKGAKWKSRRKLLTPSFHFDILKEFFPIFNEQSDVFIEELAKRMDDEWVDIFPLVSLLSLDIISETTLGVSVGAQKCSHSEYVQAVHRVSAILMDRVLSPHKWIDILYYMTREGRQLKVDLKILHEFTRNVIRERKKVFGKVVDETSGIKRKRKAFIDVLLDHHMNFGDLTEEDIREEVDTFSFEGHDTTAAGITWTLYLIGLYPEIQNKLHEELDLIFRDNELPISHEDMGELKYMECVIKESNRLYPPVPWFGRQLNKDTTISGHKILKGQMVTCMLNCLHRDPEVYPNPEVFDPERFRPENTIGRHPYAYVPFSAGPRNCIGQRFAMMEMKTVLANVLRHYRLKSLIPRDKLQVTSDIVLRPYGPLKMKILPR